MTLQLVTEEDFEQQVLTSELPVLVDLYADWCAPCKQLTPILEDLARELEGKLRIVRVDVEQSPQLAQGFRVQSIPMLVLIHQGRPIDQVVGAVDKATILKLVAPALPTKAGEVAPQDLAALVAEGRVQPVDIRDASSFGRYHIPGAVNVPAAELQTRAAELAPTDGRLRVLYGRSTDDAKDAAEALQQQGLQVGFLAGGFLHWEAEGLEVERGG